MNVDVSDNKVWKVISHVCLAISLVLGLASIGAIVWGGGSLVTEFRSAIKELRTDVDDIKLAGSPLYKTHAQLDDLRQETNDKHFARVDEAIKLIPELDKKLTVIGLKIDEITRALEEHKRQTEKQP